MSTPAASYGHVFEDGRGRACVGSTGLAVVQLVAEQAAYGWSPEELHFQHPDVSLAQIHSALAYYWDHAEEIDEVVEAQLEGIRDRLRRDGPSLLKGRLRAAQLL